MAYRVEPGGTPCHACGHGRTFDVVGPDDVAEGISFDDEEDAKDHAAALNVAFAAGAKAEAEGRFAEGQP